MSGVRVCFFFNAQRHQLLHGLSSAVELARMDGFDVHVMSPSEGHIAYARELAERLGGAPLTFSTAEPMLLKGLRHLIGASVPPKVLTLSLVARRLNRFDAIAVPERTSILLKRLGAASPRYIHLDHGAGDRAAGFDPRIRAFDMTLLPGQKHLERMTRTGLLPTGGHAVVGYPKFDAADAARDADWRPFDNGLPTVLYNPHFSELGSWPTFGERVLAAFAGQDRYNLILAPHVRMLDTAAARAAWRKLVETYAGHPLIHIDTGSDRCIDMTYTTLADIYLGDVSSQVYEFLRTPKPCAFLDHRGLAWQVDENYAHWRFGPVVRAGEDLLASIDRAIADHGRFRAIQVEGFETTFSRGAGTASRRAAEAIKGFMHGQTRHARPDRPWRAVE